MNLEGITGRVQDCVYDSGQGTNLNASVFLSKYKEIRLIILVVSVALKIAQIYFMFFWLV